VRKLEKDFDALELQHVPRELNSAADDLSARASTWAPVPGGVFERRLLKPTAQTAELGKGDQAGTSKPTVPAALHLWCPTWAVCSVEEPADLTEPPPPTLGTPDAWSSETRSPPTSTTSIMSSPKFELYGMNMSTCVRRVNTTLEELKLSDKCTLHVVDLMKGEHKAPEHLKRQPFGKIPAFTDGDLHLFESRPICQYLASAYGKDSTLYPSDPKKRALVDVWISCEVSYWTPCNELVGEVVFKPMMTKQQPDPAKVGELEKKFHENLAVFEKHLTTSKYMAGDEFTLADLYFLPYTEYFLSAKGYENFFEKYPHVNAWWKSISTRPSWLKVKSQH